MHYKLYKHCTFYKLIIIDIYIYGPNLNIIIIICVGILIADLV